MKGNPAVLGSSLTSKPTWGNTCGCSATSGFFYAVALSGRYRDTVSEVAVMATRD